MAECFSNPFPIPWAQGRSDDGSAWGGGDSGGGSTRGESNVGSAWGGDDGGGSSAQGGSEGGKGSTRKGGNADDGSAKKREEVRTAATARSGGRRGATGCGTRFA